MNHRISTVTGLAAVVLATVLASAAPAYASDTCTDSAVRCAAPSLSPYAEPLDALGGQTLAQYLTAHMARRMG